MTSSLNRSRPLALLALCCATTILISACGDSASNDAGAGGEGDCAEEVLFIGENTIQSGPAAASFAISQGFEAYLNMINEDGGVNGYTFEWEARDNGGDAAQAATVQTQFLAEDPFAISVIGTVPVTSAIEVNVSSGSDVPLMVAADGGLVEKAAERLGGGIWGFVPDYAHLGPFDARYILETLGKTSFAFAYEDNSLAQSAAAAIQEYVPANGGSLAANVPVAPGTTDYTPIAIQLSSSEADTALVWANAGVTAGIQRAAERIGYTPQWVTPFFALSTGYLEVAGETAEGTYLDAITPPPTALDDPAVQEFVDEVSAYADEAVTGSGQQGWQLAAVMVEGIRNATEESDCLTAEGFNTGVSQINGKVGLTDLDYRERPWGATDAAVFQVRQGEFVQVEPFSELPGL